MRLRPEAQPELACRYEPLVDGGRRRRTRAGTEPCRNCRRGRCGCCRGRWRWRSRRSCPTGRRCEFRCAGRQQRIARCWGPERIETGWWRGRPVGRDYYRVETAAGRRFWLFRRLRDGHWFLHGMFE